MNLRERDEEPERELQCGSDVDLGHGIELSVKWKPLEMNMREDFDEHLQAISAPLPKMWEESSADQGPELSSSCPPG